ncbi:hypothetical protein [Hwangdonia lutea]|uniref:Uncharacterized protein n=1 Tax=Hwangdonia lutea TaxID=3075823 RepID=A0AA97HSB9_9FLAO|nr:hypothetical protein [Hwangdonia sp. SCSIO 19198]WOD44698.1 hypothetical protein RNZ46_05415 [Hwangdonia sp. SCSIO 19198]
MKQTILLASLLLTIISCNKSTKNPPEEINERLLEIVKKEMSGQPIILDGKYMTPSFQVSPAIAKDSLWFSKFPFTEIKNNEVKFNFIKDKSIVEIDSELGLKYFGDSIFKYKINHQTHVLLLENNNKKIEVPYINDAGTIRLLIKKKGLEHVTIHPVK